MTNEQITFTGIGLTALLSLGNLIYSVRFNRKSRYIGSITSSRVKYMNDLRNAISDYCGLAFWAYNYHYNKEVFKMDFNETVKLEIQAEKLKNLIRLYLSPEDLIWDRIIIELVEDISKLMIKETKDILKLQDKINRLTLITQCLLQLEWQGIKYETNKGKPMPLKKLKVLSNNYINLFNKSI